MAMWGLAVCGCATVRPSAEPEGSLDGPAYAAGRASQDFPATTSAVKAAVAEAIADLDMTSRKFNRDGPVSQIDAATADHRTVTITIRPVQGRTRVGCRIGWFGDEPLSRSLLERVAIRLGTLPPAAIPGKAPSAPASNPFFSRDAVPDTVFLREMMEAPYRERVDNP
jgi:hypothetical protein